MVTVNNASRPYGSANPTFTGSVTGRAQRRHLHRHLLHHGDHTSPVGSISHHRNRHRRRPPPTTNVTVVPGNADHHPAGTPLVITVNNATRPYTALNPTFTSTITGALNGDTFTVTYSTVATQFSPVGNYAITATVSGAAAANYNITVIPGTLTITHDDAPGHYGEQRHPPYDTANPTFSSTITGQRSPATPSASPTQRSATSNIAGRELRHHRKPLRREHEPTTTSIQVVSGTLSITPATNGPGRLSATASQQAVRHCPIQHSGYAISGLLNGDTVTVTCSTVATIASPVGNYPITPSISGAGRGQLQP